MNDSKIILGGVSNDLLAVRGRENEARDVVKLGRTNSCEEVESSDDDAPISTNKTYIILFN
jgi:hypothetical protein